MNLTFWILFRTVFSGWILVWMVKAMEFEVRVEAGWEKTSVPLYVLSSDLIHHIQFWEINFKNMIRENHCFTEKQAPIRSDWVTWIIWLFLCFWRCSWAEAGTLKQDWTDPGRPMDPCTFMLHASCFNTWKRMQIKHGDIFCWLQREPRGFFLNPLQLLPAEWSWHISLWKTNIRGSTNTHKRDTRTEQHKTR